MRNHTKMIKAHQKPKCRISIIARYTFLSIVNNRKGNKKNETEPKRVIIIEWNLLTYASVSGLRFSVWFVCYWFVRHEHFILLLLLPFLFILSLLLFFFFSRMFVDVMVKIRVAAIWFRCALLTALLFMSADEYVWVCWAVMLNLR